MHHTAVFSDLGGVLFLFVEAGPGFEPTLGAMAPPEIPELPVRLEAG